MSCPYWVMGFGMILGAGGDRLGQMLPPAGVEIKSESIQLCRAGYGQSPCHRIEW